MSIQTILAAASGGTACDGAIELACRLARRYEAHVEGFHVRVDPNNIIASAGGAEFGAGMILATEWMEQIATDATARANKVKAAFLAAAARHHLPIVPVPPSVSASAVWRDEAGYAPFLISRRARFFDLVVLGRSGRAVRQPYSDTIEDTLLYSGRTVLLAPTVAPATIGESVAVAWNGSAESVRSLAQGLPFLEAARHVSIITLGDKDAAGIRSVLDYLGWHGISAVHRDFPGVTNRESASQLLKAAHDVEADLLIVGGFSRAPWREFLFGGVTHDIIEECALPILLSH